MRIVLLTARQRKGRMTFAVEGSEVQFSYYFKTTLKDERIEIEL